MLKLGRSGRERARTEETEYAHPAVPATGPGEAREVLPEFIFVFVFSKNGKGTGNVLKLGRS